MSNQLPVKKPTGELRLDHRAQVAKEIEARAGSALKEAFWKQTLHTPLGLFSRRALLLLLGGSVLLLGLFAVLIWGRIKQIPDPVTLPNGDASTVMTHVYANFSGQKIGNYQLFFPAPKETWLFNDAYTFSWRDDKGQTQQVIILSYNSLEQLETDYYYYTRSIDGSHQQDAVYRTDEVVVEMRNETAYGSLWKGMHINNVMLLMSPTTDMQHQEELYSHLISIMAAQHREFIPTATPY